MKSRKKVGIKGHVPFKIFVLVIPKKGLAEGAPPILLFVTMVSEPLLGVIPEQGACPFRHKGARSIL